MTIRGLFLLLQRLLVAVVLVASGTYLLVYLYRWEWNRALISGLFFVSAEVALASSMIMQRLHAVEARLERPAAASSAVTERLRATAPSRDNPFAWLDPRDGRVGVFVPILLGAGVVLSAIAYVVERVAQATATPVAESLLARRMAAISLSEPGVSRRAGTAAGRGGRVRSMPTMVFIAVTTALVVGVTIQVLADATAGRPDPRELPTRTSFVVHVSQRGSQVAPMDAARALWVACRTVVPRGQRTATFEVRSTDEVRVTVEPGLGPLAIRRLSGCVGDGTLAMVWANVTSVRSWF